eukprot:Hpha_TRINITY_DN16776_c4_g5::TRINITY_DN16776_c4_g5_i1::g.76514::m.76514
MFLDVAEALMARLEHVEVPLKNNALSHFICIELPDLTIIDFMEALREIVKPVEWVTVLVLIDRLLGKVGQGFNRYSCHRLILTTCVISTKLHRDKSFNKAFADLIGLELRDVNAMERAFLGLTDWEVRVSRGEYEEVVTSLAATIQVAVTKKPGRLRHAVRCGRKSIATPQPPQRPTNPETVIRM